MSSQARGPSYAAVKAWLSAHQGSIADMVRDTGYCISSVEKGIRVLRAESDPCMVNWRRAKPGAPTRPDKIAKQLERIRLKEEQRAAEAEAERERRNGIIVSALQTRTPLEEAWHA